MSRIFRALSVAALASTSTLALAQQPIQTQPAQPNQLNSIQPGQVQTTSPGQPRQVQGGQDGLQTQGVSLNSFIAHKLKRGNQVEVELGQLAIDRAKSDSVKAFAEMMVKSHQQMIQKLDQIDTKNGAVPASARDGAATARAANGQVPQMLVTITDQACDNELQLVKQMLSKHEGDDFEMAYIGQQIVAHTCMLAHLQALKSSGPQELQQLVAQGEQTTKQHLDKAMKIAAELGDDKK